MVPIIYGHQILHQIRETTPGMKGGVKLFREKGDSREWRGGKGKVESIRRDVVNTKYVHIRDVQHQ